jgi:hypothetical protein
MEWAGSRTAKRPRERRCRARFFPAGHRDSERKTSLAEPEKIVSGVVLEAARSIPDTGLV